MSDVDQRDKQLRGVLGISKFNAWIVSIIAGLFAFLSLLSFSLVSGADVRKCGAASSLFGFLFFNRGRASLGMIRELFGGLTRRSG